MSQQIEFPEASEFLQKMQIRRGVFGYDKEDVMIKMQQLNRLYQDRLLILKGQMEQERQAAREEIRRVQIEAKAEAEHLKQEARAEAEQMQKEMEEQREAMVEQIRQEERAKLLAKVQGKRKEHRKELGLLEEDLNRAAEQLQGLKGHVGQMIAELESL